jgi:hypothetical protein
MPGNLPPPMNQRLNPNRSYGLNQPVVGSQQYYELLKKYNTLLKMYRSRPATQQIRQAMPRSSAEDYDVQARLPALQHQYPEVLPNLQKYADRLNVRFNAADLTNTSEYGHTPSVEEEYQTIFNELGVNSTVPKGPNKSRCKKGGKRSYRNNKRSNNKRSNNKRSNKRSNNKRSNNKRSNKRSNRNRRTHRKR